MIITQMSLKNGAVIVLEHNLDNPAQIIIIYPNRELAKSSYQQMLKAYEKIHMVTRIED
jgi:hypothetical protein